MIVLGISAFYHDSAAALVRDGEIVAAAQEERFNRIKGDAGFPRLAVLYCLREAGLTLDDVDFVAFYDKPVLTFDRLLETYLAFAPRGFSSFVKSIPAWVKDKLFQKPQILKELRALDLGKIDDEQLLFSFHHHSHAASAFYPSPFEEAALLVMDAVGEWATTSIGVGRGSKLELLEEIRFPHSLGMLYSAFTYYLGFKVNDGEYKVMGLAPYGEPKYVDRIYDNLIDVKSDGSFRLNLDYFNYCTGLTMTSRRFDDVFDGVPPRGSSEPLEQRHMDIARSVQAVSEDIALKLCSTAHKRTGMKNLCLAGGVALNCVANGRILREGPFDGLWIQPAAGDAGGAIGAALTVSHSKNGAEKFIRNGARDGMKGAYLGPEYSDDDIRDTLQAAGAVYHHVDDGALFPTVAQALADQKVIGWFQGRMEFGPRALGNRSILGDARSESMQRVLNLKIKYRESFRPFAPAVLAEEVSDYFDLESESPYMLLVSHVLAERRSTLSNEQKMVSGLAQLDIPRSEIPAITHVDNSARVQTVHADTNPRFHLLLENFRALTGCGVLVNTSFNIRDEPIVCSPADAFACFMGTEMDLLAMGNFVVHKHEQ